MKSKNIENYRKIKRSEIFINCSKLREKEYQINKNVWTMRLIIDFFIKNEIILIKKYKKK